MELWQWIGLCVLVVLARRGIVYLCRLPEERQLRAKYPIQDIPPALVEELIEDMACQDLKRRNARIFVGQTARRTRNPDWLREEVNQELIRRSRAAQKRQNKGP